MMFHPAGGGCPLGPLLRRSNTSTAAPSPARCAAHSMPPGPPPTIPTVLPASTCGLTTLGAVPLVARRRVGTEERAGVDRDAACGAWTTPFLLQARMCLCRPITGPVSSCRSRRSLPVADDGCAQMVCSCAARFSYRLLRESLHRSNPPAAACYCSY